MSCGQKWWADHCDEVDSDNEALENRLLADQFNRKGAENVARLKRVLRNVRELINDDLTLTRSQHTLLESVRDALLEMVARDTVTHAAYVAQRKEP
jgi:hypothetical protein